MKNLGTIAMIIAAAMIIPASCKPKVSADLTKTAIIPRPVTVTATGEAFTINAKTTIFVDAGSDEILKTGRYLAEKLNASTELAIAVNEAQAEPAKGNIFLTLSGADQNLGEEGYTLTITREQVKLTAAKPAGLFRGIQTIRQTVSKDTV